MQSLWSRASWAHRCGCRACSTAVNTVGKRATARVGRRKATFTEIFTACYSSMFATAAVVDAIRKEDRRQDLDRQLAETRRELAELKAADATRREDLDFDLAELPIGQLDTLYKTIKLINRNLPPLHEIHRQTQHSSCEFVAKLKRDHFGLPGEDALRRMLEMDYGRLEKAIIREEDSDFRHRMPKNEIQTQRDSKSIINVVHQLLQRAHIMEHDWKSFEIPGEIRDIGKANFPHYDYHHSGCGEARRNTKVLNQTIREVLGNKKLDRKEQVSRICFNLLVSRYPPDIHTYNTLIVAFDQSGDYALAEALVNSFFNCRLLRPTPSTYVAILNHYKCTGNHGLFLKTLTRITGDDAGCGGKIRRRHVDDVASNHKLMSWADDTRRVTLTADWYWEHVPLNRPMLEVMINGLLHFKLFDQASSLFVSCIHAGVRLGTRSVRVVLDSCINALDMRAAAGLIAGLSTNSRQWPRVLIHLDEETKSYIVQRLCDLSELCGMDVGPDLGLGQDDLTEQDGSQIQAGLQQLPKLIGNNSVDSLGWLSHNDKRELAASRSRLLQIDSMFVEYSKVSHATQRLSESLLQSSLSLQTRQLSAELLARYQIKRSNRVRQEALYVLYEFLHSSEPRTRDDRSQQQQIALLTTIARESIRYNQGLEVRFYSLVHGVSRNAARESLILAKKQEAAKAQQPLEAARQGEKATSQTGLLAVEEVTNLHISSVATPSEVAQQPKVPSERLWETWTLPAIRRLREARV